LYRHLGFLPEHYRDEVETIVRDRVRAECGVESPGWRPPDGVDEETLYGYYRDAFAEIRGTVKDEVEGVTPGPLDVTPDPLDERTVADAEDLVTLSPSSRSTWEERDNQGERRDIAAFVPSTSPDPSGTSHELVATPRPRVLAGTRWLTEHVRRDSDDVWKLGAIAEIVGNIPERRLLNPRSGEEPSSY
jgi:hypothetical protein